MQRRIRGSRSSVGSIRLPPPLTFQYVGLRHWSRKYPQDAGKYKLALLEGDTSYRKCGCTEKRLVGDAPVTP
jgi:hypothetical protein